MQTNHARRGRAAAAVSAAMLAAMLGSTPVATAATEVPATVLTQAHTAESGEQPEPTSPTVYEFGETLANLEGKDLEVTFMAAIIPHHRAAIEMAELELERGESPDVRTHAENIIANQQHQIDQFTRWLDEWYGLTPEEAKEEAPREARREMAKMDRETEQMIKELRQVEDGEGFDKAFVVRMIPHHQGGIIEFLEPQSRAPHAQLRVAAATGILNQEAEVVDFRTWLSAQEGED
ncbi:DUF305 domain-containing protein [Arthrobacter crystallopoietes]|uniref:Uncharacterized conserved protein, DUF305 family n=1 Tax=Crystallibacter crystallopoietes TaxID=37928 RepID=A0A1H1FWT1_9MICC|nr:DUF305 domain-containing protein [Arthrobacter crystallopoietes]AUI52887.1 DUF305 domain-containing protein [Arthrobacter crystallopoietes]SDR05199.1 Uncharacterized conserved protein, DUF305 family [Arthrobacter crystallopoietes]